MTNRGTQGRAGSQQGGSGQQGEHAAVQNDSSLPQAAVHVGSCARRQLRTETGLRGGHSLGQEAFVPRALTALLGMQSLHFQNESAFLRDLFPQGAE